MTKPILCLDFDGVVHSYKSGWQGADVIPDPPVDGAIPFVLNAMNHFTVAIFSSRSHQEGGKTAMINWLRNVLMDEYHFGRIEANQVTTQILWTTEKPSAFVTIDDRSYPPWNGKFPKPKDLLSFKPWWEAMTCP